MADASFQIEVGVTSNGVSVAAQQVGEFASAAEAAAAKAAALSSAAAKQASALSDAEKAANVAAKSVERSGLKMAEAQAKLEKANAAGDIAGRAKALKSLESLQIKHDLLAATAEKTQEKMREEAGKLDALSLAARQAAADVTALAAADKAAAASAAQAADAKRQLAAEAAKQAAAAQKQADAAQKAASAAAQKQAASDAKQAATAQKQAAADAKKQASAAEQQAAEEAKASALRVNEAAEGFGKLGGPLGVLGQKAFGTAEGLKKLSTSVGAAGPYVTLAVAAVALASGIALVAAAAVKAAADVGIWATKLADAKRSNDALLAGMVNSQTEGIALGNVIGDLADELGTSTEELQRMAADLAKTGLRGRDLHEALEDAAVSAAQLKYGDDFKNGARSINAQVEKLKRNLDKMFGGLKIEVLFSKFQSLGELFDENSVSAQAIKTVFESLFQPLIDGVAGIVPKARTAFIQFEILAMKALIAIKPYGSTIMTVVQVIMGLSAVILGALAIAVGVVIANLALLAAAAGVVIAAVGALIAGVVWLGVKLVELAVQGIDWLKQKFEGIREFLAGFDLATLGTQMIDGLINGIKAAAGGVIGSVTDVVSGGINAAKKALGIASPSKVFAEIGMHTAAGMTEGVSDGAAETQGAIESLVAPPATAPGTPSSGPSSQPSAGKSGSISLQGVTFNINGVQGAADAVKQLQALLTSIIEGDLASLGGATNA